jgi:hypothetical protein
MIKCNYDVIDLFVFFIYDVQHVTTTCGSEINWIFVFKNHKLTTCILNALVFMCLRVYFKKMCGIVNLLFKLYIYVDFHQGLKNLNIYKMIYIIILF